jgi:hypothetical protein
MYYSSSNKAPSKVAIAIDKAGNKQRKLVKFDELIK